MKVILTYKLIEPALNCKVTPVSPEPPHQSWMVLKKFLVLLLAVSLKRTSLERGQWTDAQVFQYFPHSVGKLGLD